MIRFSLNAECDYCGTEQNYLTSTSYIEIDDDGYIVVTDLPDGWEFDNVSGNVTCPLCVEDISITDETPHSPNNLGQLAKRRAKE